MQGSTVFYMGNECSVIQEIDDESILISMENEIEDEMYGTVYDEVTLIVPTRFVSKTNVNISDEYMKLQSEKKKMMREIEDEKRKLELELYNKKKELSEQLTVIEDKVKKYQPLLDMYNYLEGEYQYFVYDTKSQYRDVIHTFEEMKCDFNSDELKSMMLVHYRSNDQVKRKGHFQMRIGQYSDHSGSNTAIRPFKTLEDAKQFIVEQLDSGEMEVHRSSVMYFERYGIEHEKVTEMRKKVEEEKLQQKKKDKKRLELELEKIKIELQTTYGTTS